MSSLNLPSSMSQSNCSLCQFKKSNVFCDLHFFDFLLHFHTFARILLGIGIVCHFTMFLILLIKAPDWLLNISGRIKSNAWMCPVFHGIIYLIIVALVNICLRSCSTVLFEVSVIPVTISHGEYSCKTPCLKACPWSRIQWIATGGSKSDMGRCHCMATCWRCISLVLL